MNYIYSNQCIEMILFLPILMIVLAIGFCPHWLANLFFVHFYKNKNWMFDAFVTLHVIAPINRKYIMYDHKNQDWQHLATSLSDWYSCKLIYCNWTYCRFHILNNWWNIVVSISFVSRSLQQQRCYEWTNKCKFFTNKIFELVHSKYKFVDSTKFSSQPQRFKQTI